MEKHTYTSGDLLQMFGISRQTVRQHAIEFADYLSPTANPEKGSQRNFTEDDLAVYALIAEQKKRGATYEQIHAQLRSGVRGDVPSVGPIQARTDQKAAHLERQLTIANDRLAALQTEVLKRDAQIEVYQQQVARLEKRISELDREIGSLQSKNT